MTTIFLICAIGLGVTGGGGGLRARAFLDANNVKVGDPLVLTLDFLGDADFRDVHPPALSRHADRRDWKLDDESARTATFQDGRRITYRIRPMREGLLWFPALEFWYTGADGSRKYVRANAIPVHAKAGSQVAVAEMPEDEDALAKPPEIVRDPAWGGGGGTPPGPDELFAWRRACASPAPGAFDGFDFPAARMNEAICELRAGGWSKALSILRKLEWRTGQTPEIEQAIVAAIALRTEGKSAELPMWRQTLRPLLRHPWPGRAGIVAGCAAALALLFALLGRAIRALACIAVLFAAATASAAPQNDPFAAFFDNFDPFGARRAGAVKVDISVYMDADKKSPAVGENFTLFLQLAMPKDVELQGGVQLSIAESDRLRQTEQGYKFAPVPTNGGTNKIEKFAFPMRSLAPLAAPLHFSVTGRYTLKRGGAFSFFSVTQPFDSGPRTFDFRVLPPPEEGRPANYAGVVADKIDIFELPDILRVETNDVATITYKARVRGYVPQDCLPEGAAFEWTRRPSQDGGSVEIEYKRYVVADGSPATPKFEIPYYDPESKSYKTASAGGTKFAYAAERE